MKRQLFILILLAILFCPQSYALSQAIPTTGAQQSQQQPLTLEELEAFIRIATNSEKDANSKDRLIAKRISLRGTTFQPTDFFIEELRKIGAGRATIRALEDLRQRWPKNTRAPGESDDYKIRILLADFQGPENKDENVTNIIKGELDDATREYPEVEIIPLNETITAKQGRNWASQKGKEYKASIVIWGWYTVRQDQVFASVHFQVLDNSLGFLLYQEKFPFQLHLAELLSFQIRLSKEMTYLTFFTLGVIRMREGDFAGAVDLFTSAISRFKAEEQVVTPAAAYQFRAISSTLQALLVFGKVPAQVLNDLDKVIELEPENAGAYTFRCSVHSLRKEFELALKDCARAIELEPNNAQAYSDRANVFQQKGDRESAIASIETAIKLAQADPTDKRIFFYRTVWSSLKRDLDGMLSSLDELLKLDLPPFISQFFLLGRAFAYSEKNLYEPASKDLRKAIELVPTSPLGYWLLGDVYYETKDYQQAITNYKKAIELGLKDAQVYIDLAKSYRESGDANAALNSYAKAIEIEPAVGYEERGHFYRHKGEFGLAIDDYDKALTLNPQNGYGYFFRGSAHLFRGNPDKAIEDYDRAIKLVPDSTTVYHFRGNAYDAKREWGRAIDDYKKAIELGLKEAQIYIDLGKAYEKNGDSPEALKNYSKAIEVEPNNVEAYEKLGDYYLTKEEFDNAIENYNKAIRINPKKGSVYFSLASAYYSKGDLDKALSTYDAALKLIPQAAGAYYFRGLIYGKKGAPGIAIDNYTLAIKFNPKFVSAYLERAVLYLRKGDYDDAIKDLDEVIKIKPDHARAYYGLGLAYLLKQDRDSAISNFNKVLQLTNDPELRKLTEQYLTSLGVEQVVPK
ncbi:MAG TPA: tetratricopeptide repeat protein [Pyrinomonadaceae bacterium]|jgi:tetratricopeptide (TPR) repeat protein|nr:tetratricopeptide repeat protein [Pyrinomonadaceae bacterium]